MKRDYWVFWVYSANYANGWCRVSAESPEEAAEVVTAMYSDSFRKRGTVYVSEQRPIALHNGQRIE